jgi:hypothetical protein
MTAPTPRHRKAIVFSILGVFAATILAVTITANNHGTPDPVNPLQAPTAEYATGAAPEVATTTTPTTTPPLPGIGDITLTTIITSQQCFGSSGCDVRWKMQASTALDMSQWPDMTLWPDTFTITFTVAGIQGGYTGSLEYEGSGQFGGDIDGFGETASHVDTLVPTVTEIS